jgi:hypothetical protein
MKKQFVLLTTALAVFALTFSSCKKDSDNPSPTNNTPAPAPTKTQLLTANSWKATSMVSMGFDFFPHMSACEKDNFLTIKADGTYIEDEGATKCDPTDPQTSNGLWKFVNNQSAIVLDGGDTAIILALTAESMKLETPYEDDEGKHVTVITTFVKK